MIKNHLRFFLYSLAILFVFTACEKESIETATVPTVTFSKEDLAKKYLDKIDITLPFAVLEMNHKTHHIQGFFIDKTQNIRTVDMKDVTYLRFDEAYLAAYFMEILHENSTVKEGAGIDIVELADKFKKTRTFRPDVDFTSDDTQQNSKLFLTFNSYLVDQFHQGCGGSNQEEKYYNTILLSAQGHLNYEPVSEKEKELVDWLKNVEKETYDK